MELKTAKLNSFNDLNDNKSRDISIDFAKGVLISLVVLGHAPTFNLSNIIYWFHMPAFFFVSGFLWKGDKINLLKLSEKVRRLVIPYFSFGILFSIYIFLSSSYSSKTLTINIFIGLIVKLLYGGRLLQGFFGVFWFINVLIILNVLMFFLIRIKKIIAILLVILFYIISHYLSYEYLNNSPNVFWNIDSALYSITFFYSGFLIKPYGDVLKKHWVGILLILIGGLFLTLQFNGLINFHLDVKYLYLRNFLLDLLIPFIFIFTIFYISSLFIKFSLSNLLVFIGQNSLIIIYLHIPSNKFISILWGSEYHYFSFLFIGVSLPLIAMALLRQNTYTKYLFLGK